MQRNNFRTEGSIKYVKMKSKKAKMLKNISVFSKVKRKLDCKAKILYHTELYINLHIRQTFFILHKKVERNIHNVSKEHSSGLFIVNILKL